MNEPLPFLPLTYTFNPHEGIILFILRPLIEDPVRSASFQLFSYVNFIHQKDAYIAMKVVKQLTLQRKPVYTVHDNFITTAVSAAGVPEVYTKVFMEMGPPLRIINEFILLNLIQSSGGASPFHPDWVNDPIPGDELQTLLISLEPQDLKNKNWSKKVKEAVSCYEKYVNTVCGGQPHAEKWNSFHSILNGWESLGFNYSVHY
uniref:RNA polymerase n=1 Tax=Picea glauca TaxID=3330 RepID=A0A101LW92_PICGL|nr:RNA polymerase [Picea glauca]